MIQLKTNIKTREEDGFYLIVNLTTEDMLNGYPAFFKTNAIGKYILELLHEPTSIENITKQLKSNYTSIDQRTLDVHASSFIEKLKQYSLISEIKEDME